MLNNRYLIYLFIISFLFSSCTDSNIANKFDNEKAENDQIVLTPEEFASIAYGQSARTDYRRNQQYCC